jgi:hypothetical protein
VIIPDFLPSLLKISHNRVNATAVKPNTIAEGRRISVKGSSAML